MITWTSVSGRQAASTNGNTHAGAATYDVVYPAVTMTWQPARPGAATSSARTRANDGAANLP